MIRKIKIAKNMRKRCLAEQNNISRKMLLKCYRTYIIKHIIFRKVVFQLVFKGKYIESFYERCNNWKNYVWGVITHKECNCKPIHCKSVELDESVLCDFLQENHMEVLQEDYYCESLVYEVFAN